MVPPLELSVVYRVASLDDIDALYEGRQSGFFYARDGHPNLVQFAAKIATLEGAQAAWVGASGMAVESALMLTILAQGSHIALADGVYGKTGRLAQDLGRFGVSTSRFDAAEPARLQAALAPETRLVFAETLSNPLLRVAGLAALARIAHEAGAVFAVDHTFAPLLCRPIDLGADLVVHSVTKLIGGHSDVTLGAIAGRRDLIGRIAAIGSTFGLTGNPFECWLAARGLTTLAVRSRQACASALVLAERLRACPAVETVHYPGLATHPDHALARSLFSGGFGTIVTFDLGSRDRADALIRALSDTIPFAPSLGDVATTLSHPATTSHRGQSPEQWARQGITPGLIRLSVGLEQPDDLWAELDAALGQIHGV
jgi:cystathionine beta-lyase/cystathionine gamma-synthase